METTMKKIYFSEEIAVYLGKVDEAIFLHNICYWVEINKLQDNNYEDGEYWTYNSDTTFSEIYPYFSPAVIRRMRNNLLKNGLIKTGRFNKWRQDKTTWYTYTDKVFEIAHPDYIRSISRSNDEIFRPYD